ncbi:transglutaminase-like cysteine peptidase [Phenylobacterium sp. LjRoot225]|uniref:transglutaminase-like cysteine peptidase n=1 Tax=Phenylobacterium sp. LjRoot225 TaxID=3342285 RepID=UPI003ED061ED
MTRACPKSKHRSWWMRVAAGVALSGALAAAAQAETPSSSFMAQGDHMAAPTGFADYCQRTIQCVAAPSAQPTTVVEFDRATRSLIDAVNRGVNRAIVATSDQDVYGVTEVWADPLAEAGAQAQRTRGFARGDCEDFALAKRDRLLKAGWPPEAMFLAVAYHPTVGLHAVLVVRTSAGDLVLDSRSPYVDLWSATTYVWVERQVNATSVAWVRPYRAAVPEQALAQLRADDATAGTEPG